MKNIKNHGEFRIRVINDQTSAGETDRIEESAVGTYRTEKGKFYIKYRVNEYLNMIRIDGGTVTVSRSGDIRSQMRYEAGKSTEFVYSTPYGDIQMKLHTSLVESKLDSEGGMVRLEYILDTGGDKYKNSMRIIIER